MVFWHLKQPNELPSSERCHCQWISTKLKKRYQRIIKLINMPMDNNWVYPVDLPCGPSLWTLDTSCGTSHWSNNCDPNLLWIQHWRRPINQSTKQNQEGLNQHSNIFLYILYYLLFIYLLLIYYVCLKSCINYSTMF